MMNKRFLNWPRLLLALLLTYNFSAFAETTGDFQYPELLVTPLASERIKMEAKEENKSEQIWLDHSPVLVSSTLTMLAALSLRKDKNDLPMEERSDAKNTSAFALGVGAFWLTYSSYLAFTYRPYSDATRDLSSAPNTSSKDRLTRERLAEEKLSEAASFGRSLSWLSSGTLFFSSIALSSFEKGDSEAVALVAALSSLSPLFFSYRWQKVHSYHGDYKKRIYGPIVTSSLYGTGKDNKWAPLLLVSSSF